jgi:tetratricopeptide (TPR) repeat protein
VTAVAAVAATAVFVAVAVDSEGSYFAGAWPLVGGVLVLGVWAAALRGGRVSGWTPLASAGFALFGGLCALSVVWGGLPDAAWTWLDQMLIAAAALLLGALAASLGGTAGRRAVVTGVLAGTVGEAVYMLWRLAAGAPSSWFDGRQVVGPVQYHNAQGACFAIAVPLALWASTRRPVVVRAAAGVGVAALGAGVLATQSRGALGAAALAVAVQIALVRNLRLAAHAVVVAFALALLVLPLRTVDAALVGTTGDVAAFRSYGGWAILCAAALAAVFAVPVERRGTLGVAAVAAALVVAGFAVAIPRAGDAAPALRHALNGQKTADLPAGETRLGSLSLSGRRTIWRIALDAYAGRPAAGRGSGSFTSYFTERRTNKDLYILQPHSLELEALAELGTVGAAVLVAAFALLAVALARSPASRGLKAAAAGAAIALVAQASIDWTFSFPALLVQAFLVVGAVAGGRARAGPPAGTLAAVGWTTAAVAALVLFAGPYLASHDLSAARASTTPRAEAWTLLRHARAFDPWNPDVLDAQGQEAEDAGRYDLAATLYGRAAKLSRNAWVEHYRRARALRSAGRTAEARTACSLARRLNPVEPLLDRGACSFDSP